MLILGIIIGFWVSYFLGFFCSEGDGRQAFKYQLQNRYLSLLVVGINGILYYLIGLQVNLTIELVYSSFISSLLLLIGVIDYRTSYVYRLPILVGYVVGIGFLFTELSTPGIILNRVLGAGLGFIIIHLIIKLTDGMGQGDRDIALLCGLFLGLRGVFITLFLAFVMGAIFSVGLMFFKEMSLKHEIPFGPFLAIGGILTLLYEGQMVELYWQLLS